MMARRLTAEFLGTAMLLAAVVGSGIMGERLSGGNVGVALLANTISTGAALVALILTLASLSGVLGCSRTRAAAVPFAVGAYITAAYWFTASTSFANPAVTLARALSDSFSGIRPGDVPGFIIAQILGGAAATAVFSWLFRQPPAPAVAEARQRGAS